MRDETECDGLAEREKEMELWFEYSAFVVTRFEYKVQPLGGQNRAQNLRFRGAEQGSGFRHSFFISTLALTQSLGHPPRNSLEAKVPRAPRQKSGDLIMILHCKRQ